MSKDIILTTKTGAPMLNLPKNRGEIVISNRAKDRTLERFDRELIPSSVKSILAGALHGDLTKQELLFNGMLDSWPRLQVNLKKIQDRVAGIDWTVNAWAPRGGQPSKRSIKRATDVENVLWNMKSNTLHRQKGFLGTIRDLAYGYYAGHTVSEVFWDNDSIFDLPWVPSSTRSISARFYRYSTPVTRSGIDESDDILMLNPDGDFRTDRLQSFEQRRYEGKFLIGIRQGHRGPPAVAAPLRALSQWWLAATYGIKWFMQFAQIAGIPVRWGKYPSGDKESQAAVCDMLENMGQTAWAAVPDGAELNFVESAKNAHDIPQKVMIDLADRVCDVMVLGATLTTDASDSGSRALGTVHQDTERDAVQSVASFVSDVLNEQLIPSIMRVNFADVKEMPWISGTAPRPKDELSMAMRDQKLFMEMKMPVALDWLADRHTVPLPGEGEKLYEPPEEVPAFNPQDVKEEKKIDQPPKPEDPDDSDNPDSPKSDE